MLLAMKDEAESNLNNEENDFMLDTSYGEETMEELTATLMLMARIQPTDGNAETVPSYDAKAISKVNASSKVHKQVSHMKCKTIQTFNDDQIHFNIIFDYPYVENNGSTSQHDSNAHDEYHEIQMLTYNVQKEAENKKRLNNELKKRKYCYKKELEMCKDMVKIKDYFAVIIVYGDYVQGNLMICHVYYVEGLGYKLFLIRQFYVGDLEVAFRSNTCYVWNLEGDDLLIGSRDSNLYTISISEMAASSPTHYELIRGQKPNIQYFYVFGSLCYPTNDRDDLGKMKPKADIEDEALQKVSSSTEQVVTEPNSPILNENIDELLQELDAKFDGNVFYNVPQTPMFEEAESSSTC
nr:integrase, catalytic region, zinc finger, CCHC-type, peptidase aspartic, catalytic [Tanacetum cinerariifolium]